MKIDIFTDGPFNELYYNVPNAWGGQSGESIPRPQPSDFVRDFFEDIQEFIEGKQGFFVDVGASDGIIWNTTLGLELDGWKGICIEPHPTIFQKLLEGIHGIKRTAECLNIAITKEAQTCDFQMFEGDWDSYMLSGIVNNYDTRQHDREDFKRHATNSKIVSVSGVPLQSILDERDITHINYLSIDTEGSEIEVLKSIDFNKTTFDLISVETNFESNEIEEILTANGYKFITKVCCDSFFAKTS